MQPRSHVGQTHILSDTTLRPPINDHQTTDHNHPAQLFTCLAPPNFFLLAFFVIHSMGSYALSVFSFPRKQNHSYCHDGSGNLVNLPSPTLIWYFPRLCLFVQIQAQISFRMRKASKTGKSAWNGRKSQCYISLYSQNLWYHDQ